MEITPVSTTYTPASPPDLMGTCSLGLAMSPVRNGPVECQDMIEMHTLLYFLTRPRHK